MKPILTLLLVAGYLLYPHHSPASEGILLAHVLAPFRHANVFHLAGNIFCLWMLHLNRSAPIPAHPSSSQLIPAKSQPDPSPSKKLPSLGEAGGGLSSWEPLSRILQGVAITFLCGFLHWSSPTIGFSGAIFAMVGVMWGECLSDAHGTRIPKVLRRFATMCLPWAVVGIVIPHIDGVLHTACLLTGLFYGYLARARR